MASAGPSGAAADAAATPRAAATIDAGLIPLFLQRVAEVNNGLGAVASMTPFVLDGATLGHLKPECVEGFFCFCCVWIAGHQP